MEEYTKFRNENRGYMKLRVWHKAIELYKLVCRIVYKDNKIDFKLRAQIVDAAQSVSSNISEGYSRRSINEYIQQVYIALGSLSETLTRAVAFKAAEQISPEQFTELDTLHYGLRITSGNCWSAWKKNATTARGSLGLQKILKHSIRRKLRIDGSME